MALEVYIAAQRVLNTEGEYGAKIYRENRGNIMSEESDAATVHERSLWIKAISRECSNNGQTLVLMKPLARTPGRP